MDATNKTVSADYDRDSHVEDFCHHPIEQDADGLWHCAGKNCAKDHETQRACEDACLAKVKDNRDYADVDFRPW